VFLLGPLGDRHDSGDLGRRHERTTAIAVSAVHGSLSAHFDAAADLVVRECSACLFQSRTLGFAWRSLSTPERPPAPDALVGPGEGAPRVTARRPVRSRAPPRLA
jgi:hypothetical protein